MHILVFVQWTWPKVQNRIGASAVPEMNAVS